MIKTCLFSKKLSLLIDGELPEDQKDKVRKHLRACETCRNELSRLQSVDRLLTDLPQIEPSDRFDRQFWEKVNSLKYQKNKRLKKEGLFNWISLWGLKPSLAAAAAVLAIAAGVLLYVKSSTQPLNSEDVSISENMEFYSDLEMVNHLDLLEHWDEIKSVNGRS